MVYATHGLTVQQQQRRQRLERLAGMAALVACALAGAASFVLLGGPLPVAVGLGVLLLATAIALRPRFGLYLLLFCAIFLEQFGIAGLDPLTTRLPFYQTLSGSGILPIPVSPVEMILLLTLAVVLLPHIARRDLTFVRGSLFVPCFAAVQALPQAMLVAQVWARELVSEAGLLGFQGCDP